MRILLALAMLQATATAQQFNVIVQEFQVKVERPKLYVTSARFRCPPCEALKRDRENHLLDQFEFPRYSATEEFYPTWPGFRSYPAIRFRDRKGEWKVIYGYNEAIRKSLIEQLVVVVEVKSKTTQHRARD